jgi:DNA-binding NarL/FixJ family response regulator
MKHFLIADPHPHTRRAFALLLEHRLGASDIREAWDCASLERELARAAPDALVLDCHLPGVSPAEIAQLAQRLAAGRLILMSVDADDVATAQALDVAFIYKGALPEEVLGALGG